MSDPEPFLRSAPLALIKFHNKNIREKAILGRLLTDERMKRSWTILRKRISKEEDYVRLWKEIEYALYKSHRPEPSRIRKRDHFLSIVKNAEELAKAIENERWWLNELSYEFFSDEDARASFWVNQWSELGEEARRTIAFKNLRHWPSMSDLLRELAARAKACASAALTEKRTVERDTHDRQLNYFLRHLARYFRHCFDGPMQGTLANIASVVFERRIDKRFVKQALRHEKGGA